MCISPVSYAAFTRNGAPTRYEGSQSIVSQQDNDREEEPGHVAVTIYVPTVSVGVWKERDS